MAVTFNTYSGNGTTGPFSFTFEYIDETDVKVSIDAVTQPATAYTFPTASTIQFVSLTPTASQTIRIFRDTDVDELKATFFAGSSIRSQDLNDNFEQNNFAVQEIKAQYVTKENGEFTTNVDLNNNRLTDVGDPVNAQDAVTKQYLEDNYFDDDTETILSTETWPGNNTTIATTLAIDGRVDSKIDTAIEGDILVDSTGLTKTASGGQVTLGIGAGSVDLDRIKDADIITSSETNPNNDTTIATTAKIDDMIDDAVTNDILIESNGLTKSTSGGQTTLGIGAGAVDLDRIKSDDIVETSAYSSTWTSEDDKIVTAGALAARHDLVVNTNVTPPSTAQVGKQWLSTAPGNQVHKIYDGSGWRTVAVGQPYSPATTTVVRYVDVTNGSDASDVTGFLPQAPLQSIGRALDLINASSSGDGSLIKVAPGVYQETLPLRIKKNNVSIVGESMRSCFVHPTVATENNDMFEVDSGTYIANLTLLGLKVPTSDQSSRNNSLDNDATYGLPSNQPFSVRFRTDTQPTILKSPYIQNCTHFSDAHFDNANFDPNTFPSTDGQTYSAVAGDESSAPCGGGLLVDGSAVSSSSPIRSMVVDAFTQITLDGPGILVTNNGYAQLVSFFGTFAHYHAKAKNGGQINLSNCVSDFGRYGLIADGKSPSAIATATASAANSGATTITIGAIATAGSFHGTVSRPLDHMMVTIDGVDYGVVSSTANGSGWDIVLTSGLTSNITNTTVSFALRSYISTGGHTFEFVGVGTDYGDHPDNGGVPVEANQVIELNGGKVWQSSTDHVGKFKAGNVLVVNQVSETVDLKATTVTGNLAVTGTVDGRDVATDGTKLDGIATGATAYSNSDVDTHLNQSTAGTNEVLSWNGSDYDWVAQSSGGGGLSDLVSDTTPQLGGNLDVNGQDIVSVSNGDIDLDPNGSGVVVFKGNSTKGSGQFKLNCENNSHGITIKGPAHSAGANYTLTLPTTDGSADEILKTDGSGNLSWAAQSGLSNNGTGTNSLGIGTNTLDSEQSGAERNIAFGDEAITAVTTGDDNIAIGYEAGKAATTGSNSIFIGTGAGKSQTSSDNLYIGHNAGQNITSGHSNTIIGTRAQATGSGSAVYSNTAVGKEALRNCRTSANTAVGTNALYAATTGGFNTALGSLAGDSITTGTEGVFIGAGAAADATTSNSLVCVGFEAGKSTSGYSNTFVGHKAGRNGAGAGSTCIGADAGRDSTGQNSTFVGVSAGYLATGGQNTCLGYTSGTALTSGASNTFAGYESGRNQTSANNNTLLGYQAGRAVTTGSFNTALGFGASKNTTTGQNNVVIGYEAGDSLTTGGDNVAIGSGAGKVYGNAGECTSVGYRALYNSNQDGNTAFGARAGHDVSSGENNTFLGRKAGETFTTGSNTTAIGNGAAPSSNTVSNEITLGNASVTSLRIPGLQSGASNGQVLTYNSTNGNITLADAGGSLTGRTDSATPFVTSLGHEAADSVTSTSYNIIAIGYQAAKNTTGRGNIAIGKTSLFTNTSGEYNVAIGGNALYNNATGSKNLSIGQSTLSSNTTGYENTAVGYRALKSNTTAASNTAVGSDALYSCTTGAGNTAVGYQAGNSITTALYNTVVGYGSFTATTTGQYNAGLGFQSGLRNTTGISNTAVGYNALTFNVTGSKNTVIGYQAVYGSSGNSNEENTAVGYQAGYSLSTGSYSVMVGNETGYSITTGANNTAVGHGALRATTTSSYNTAIGYQAGKFNTTGQRNTFLGYAGFSNTTGNEVTAVGYGAGYSTTVEAGSTYIGAYSGQQQTGSNNAAVGTYALYGTSGSSGIHNTALGYMSGYAMVGGDRNTLVGSNAGDSITSGDNNTCIGNHADASSATVDNEITLGNVNVATLRCNTQTISSLSDGRDKTEVEELPLGLDFIDTLRPVKFKWDTRDGNGKDGTYDAGFIAQDLQSAQSTSDAEYLKMVMDSNPDRLEARYGQLIPVLVQAIKDLKAEIDTLKANA